VLAAAIAHALGERGMAEAIVGGALLGILEAFVSGADRLMKTMTATVAKRAGGG
jgi:hypothetical protein